MKKVKILLFSLAVPLFLITSCKKDADTFDEITYKGPSAAGRTTVVDIPAGLTLKANGGDNNALIAITYMNLANAISSFSTAFTLPTNSEIQNKNSTSNVYFWTYSGYSYWMTYTELTDKYTWKYEWQLPNVARFTYISAEESKTGKQGSWTINNPESTTSALWTYNWSINISNTFTANMTFNGGQGVLSSFDAIANADKSGSFVYKVGGVKEAEIIWTSTGTGTFWLKGDVEAITGSW